MSNVIGKGIGVVNGTVQGTARWSNADGSNIEEGDILLSEMTDANMIAGIHRAEGVVTVNGGKTCHAAVVAMGSNKITVVGVGKTLHSIKDGDMVTLNGTTGEVARG